MARALLRDLQMRQWGTHKRRIVMVLGCESIDDAPDNPVATPSTPLDVIQTLLAEPIESIVIYRDAGWATGMYELLTEEFPSRRVAVM